VLKKDLVEPITLGSDTCVPPVGVFSLHITRNNIYDHERPHPPRRRHHTGVQISPRHRHVMGSDPSVSEIENSIMTRGGQTLYVGIGFSTNSSWLFFLFVLFCVVLLEGSVLASVVEFNWDEEEDDADDCT
jgi:hypothetical protein